MLAKKNILFGGVDFKGNFPNVVCLNNRHAAIENMLCTNIKSQTNAITCDKNDVKLISKLEDNNTTLVVYVTQESTLPDKINVNDYINVEINCESKSSSVNSTGGSYRRKTKKGGVGGVGLFKKIKIFFKNNIINTINLTSVDINVEIGKMCDTFLKNIHIENNFIELNDKITAIVGTTRVNEHEIFTIRVDESQTIAKELLKQINDNKFPFNDNTKGIIKKSLEKITNLNKYNVSSADIINIMNYTKYLDSNFAIIYYRNNNKLNLDFLLALNSQKNLLNTTSTILIEKNFSKLFGQVIQKIIMDYILIEKYFTTSSVNNYFITQILQDNLVNFSGIINTNKKYKTTLISLINKLTLENTNTTNNVKKFLTTIVNKTTTDKNSTTSYPVKEFIDSDFSKNMNEVDIYYFLHIIKMLFIYDSEYSAQSLDGTTEEVIDHYSDDLLQESTITLSDLSWYLYYINYEKDISTGDGESNAGDGASNVGRVLQHKEYVNIVTLTNSQIYLLIKYFPNTIINNFLKIIKQFEDILVNKRHKLKFIMTETNIFRDNLFNHVMYPEYYNVDNVFDYLNVSMEDTEKSQLKNLINNIQKPPGQVRGQEVGQVQEGGQRKYLPELYKCKDNRYRKVFLIKGKGNTKFVVSKNKVVKASSIPCVKKVNK